MYIQLKKSYYIVCLLLVGLCGFAEAGKDRAPVFITGRALDKVKSVSILGVAVTEKYWLVEITVKNLGNQDLPVSSNQFLLLSSDGYSASFSKVDEISARDLFSKVTVHPNETVRGMLGFKLKNKESYPVNIVFETTFLTATGSIYLVNQAQANRTGLIKEETPYSPPPTPVHVLTPQEQEEQRMRSRAAKEASLAKDSALGDAQADIITKNMELQDKNKQAYESKKITFDEFMKTKDSIDRNKQKELVEAAQKGEDVYNKTYTKYTSDFYQKKK